MILWELQDQAKFSDNLKVNWFDTIAKSRSWWTILWVAGTDWESSIQVMGLVENRLSRIPVDATRKRLNHRSLSSFVQRHENECWSGKVAVQCPFCRGIFHKWTPVSASGLTRWKNARATFRDLKLPEEPFARVPFRLATLGKRRDSRNKKFGRGFFLGLSI